MQPLLVNANTEAEVVLETSATC